jgi:hypothetical protein
MKNLGKLFLLLLIISCRDRYPLKIDYEIASAKILGQEKCFIHQPDNLWLVSLTPLDPAKEYGDEIVYHGKKYSNVVKVKEDLTKEFKDSTVKYYFDFYMDHTPQQVCTIDNPDHFSIPQIRIKSITPGG